MERNVKSKNQNGKLNKRNSKALSKPGYGRRLTEPEKIAILLDLENDLSWDAIQTKHSISRSTISHIRNHWLSQNERATELIKKVRPSKLYQTSDKYLDELHLRDPSTIKNPREVATIYGILQDKLNVIEGLTGLVSAIHPKTKTAN